MEKRNTIQKRLVLDAVCALADHTTAEQVYAEVVQHHPSISKATVYRNLNSLAQDGQLRHIPLANGADRFDHYLQPHSHIECTECGCFCDVHITCDESLDAKVEELTGYQNSTHELVFRGICPSCAHKAAHKAG